MTFPIDLPADDAAPYTYTQPIRDAISAVNDHEGRIDNLEANPGGGSGAVDSVNGQTGVVVLDADDLADGSSKVQMTTAERTKLSGVASGATANASDAQLRDRATHTGTQLAATISDLTEAVQDAAAALLTAGVHTGITATYVDGSNRLDLTASGGTGGGPMTINAQTGTSYTFVLSDANTTLVRAGNAGAQTYTIPPNSSVNFPVGASLTIVRYGAGALSLVAGAGVTLRPSSPQTARAQYSTITAIQLAANEWLVGGDVT